MDLTKIGRIFGGLWLFFQRQISLIDQCSLEIIAILNSRLARKMSMEFKATFKNMIGLAVLLSLLAVLSMFSGIYGNAPGMEVLGIVLALFLVIIRFRFKVYIDEQQLSSTGFVSTKTVRWSDINRVVRVADCGYPKDRFYGPFVYEFQTANDSLKINFKLFSIECMTEAMKRVDNLATR
jgi:hypothetical protein